MDDYDAVLDTVEAEAAAAMNNDSKNALDEIEQKIISVQEHVLELHKQKKRQIISEAYYNAQIEKHSNMLRDLDAEQQRLQTIDARYATVRMWLNDFKKHIQNGDATDDQDGKLMKGLVEAIIVWPERMEIRFKCGVTVEQEYVK